MVPIEPVSTTEPTAPPAPLTIGPAATDTYGGWIPDGQTLSPFDVSNPALAQLDPALLNAVQEAARAAAQDGVDLRITSGWRSKGFQEKLFDDAERGANATLTVDLEKQEIRGPDGGVVKFEIDAHRKHCMLNGLDDIGLTMVKAKKIDDFESKAKAARPWA